MGKCFDEDSCSRIIEVAIQRAHAACDGYVPTKLLEEAVYVDDDGKAFAEHAAAKCPEKDARGHIGNMIGFLSRRYTDSDEHNPNNLRGQPYYCAYGQVRMSKGQPNKNLVIQTDRIERGRQ